MVTLLPDAVRRMREHFRGIELSIRPGTSIQLHRMLEMGEIDCAVMTHPPFPLAKTFFWRGLRVYPLALLGPEDRMQGGIEEILRREPFIRIDQNVWTGRLVTAFLAKRGWSVNSIIEMDGLEVILMLVGRGMGVTLMPDWGAGQYSEPRLRRIVVSDPAYRRETGLLGQRGPREGLIDAFLTTLVPSAP
jgi:DNA-binding transcriptional LysR family regulator